MIGRRVGSKDIEKWGSGLKRISKQCAASGVRVEFKVLISGFLVTFHRKLAKGLFPSTGEETRDKLLALIGSFPTITIERLARLAGISAKGVEWNIAKLKAEGLLRRVGSRKAGRWEVVK